MYQNKRNISSLRAAYYFDTVIKKDKNRRFVNIDDNYKIKTSRSGRFELMCDRDIVLPFVFVWLSLLRVACVQYYGGSCIIFT